MAAVLRDWVCPRLAPQTIDQAFALLEGLDERLAGHHRLYAVRAHLLEINGDREAAIVHYRAAAGRTTSLAERDHLLTRAARLTAGNR